MTTETATQQEAIDSPDSPDLSTLPASKVIETIEQFREAIAAAKRAAAAYYDTDVLVMSDSEYDALVERIAVAQAEHPDWDDDGVLTQVAAGASAGGSLEHPQPMLSLSKTTEPSAMAAFVTAMPGRCVVEVKLDGNAVRGSYSNGLLVALATRGDGVSGEPLDITMDIAGLPKKIDLPGDVHVTGEVYMTETGFERTCANRVASGKEAFANARNATAGVLRRQERTFEAYLSFAAYHAFGTPELDNIDSYPERMAALANQGVQTVQSLQESLNLTTVVTSAAADVTTQIVAMEAARSSLPLDIDGAVVKIDSYTQRATIGVATRHPKWALAFKFAPTETTSYLADIEVAVGRSGKMSLTGVLDPAVEIDGVLVTRATLHNPDFVKQQNLGIGSKCLVTRQGDVIPRIQGALGDQPEGVVAWTPPPTCPKCDQPWNCSEVIPRCMTPTCSTVGKISYAASRDVLDIAGLGEEVATALVEAGLVNDVADLFTLTTASVAATQIGVTSTGNPKLIGETIATKIVNGIAASKSQPLNRIVCSLGISKMGRTMSRRIATHFQTLDAIRAADEEAFAQVDGVAADGKAAIYVDGFAAMADVLDRMVAAGVTTETQKAPADDGGTLPLAGMKVVVTGSMAGSPLSGLNRTQMNELIEAAGGQASGSVSKSTSLLVCGEPGSSKHAKAVSLNVPVVHPDEFAATVAAFL